MAMQPFKRHQIKVNPNFDFKEAARKSGISEADARARYENTIRYDEVYVNNMYQVNIRRHDESTPKIIHLSIKRLDKKPIRDWRHLQRIKNELTDPEFEAIELFPAESRLIDTANQFHLWVFADKTFRCGIGFNEGRKVDYESSNGVVQRGREK